MSTLKRDLIDSIRLIDGDLAIAREAAALINEMSTYPHLAKGYRAGSYDHEPEVQIALEALRLARMGDQ